MTWNIKKSVLGITLSLLILLACFALGLLPLNLFFLKTAINETVRERTGVELIIEGPLRLKLGWSPKLTARRMTLSFPEVTEQPSVFISDASVQTRVLSVMRGDIDLSSINARGIVVDYGPGDVNVKLPENLRLDAAAPLGQTLNVQLSGQHAGDTLSLNLTGASLNHLLEASQAYPFEANLDTPASALQFDGDLLLPWSAPGLAGKLTANSNDLAALLRQFDQQFPTLGALAVQSDIRLSETALELENIQGNLDGFTFMLSVVARDWSSRPWVEVEALFPLLDLAAIPGISTDAVATGTDNKFELQSVFDQLSSFDGRVEISIGQVQNAPLAIDDLTFNANLDQGQLVIEDAAATISGTELTAQASLDTSAVCAQLETSIQVSHFELETLAPFLAPDSDLVGRLKDGWIRTYSCGSSFDQHLHSLQTVVAVAAMELSGPEDQPPLRFGNINAEVGWLQAGRISFETELMDEALSVALNFGSVDQITADELWPVEFSARAKSFGLEFSGQTALHDTGLILDLSLDVQLGKTDITGQLAWSGPGSGRPVVMDLRSDLLNLPDIEVLLPESSPDEPAPELDWAKFLDESALIEYWLDFASIDVKLVANQLLGTPYEINNMGLSARLEDRKLEGGRMHFSYEGVELEGVLNADMSKPTALFDFQASLKNLDIGRLIRTVDASNDIDAWAEQADIRIETEGSTLRELARNTRIESSLQSLHWTFTAGPENRRFDMTLSELSLKESPGSDAVWETRGSLNGSPIKAWMKTPNLRITFDENLPLPVKFIARTGSDLTMIDVVVYPETENSLRSEVRVSGRYASAENTDFSTLPTPLEDFSFSTDLTIRNNEYLASDIRARIGSSSATGAFGIHPSDQGFHFTLEADAPLLETDDLVRWIKELRETSRILSGPESSNSDPANVNVGLLSLIDQFVDEFIGDNSWSVSVNISELKSGGQLLGETELGLKMDSDKVILEPATIRMPGGNVVTHYSGQRDASGWDYVFDVYVERLEYGGLLRLFDPDSTAGGEIHVNTSLHSRSEDAADAVNNLAGHVDIAVFPDDVQADFLDLWASNLVLALLPAGENNSKKLNCMVARFEVEGGVMKSSETFLDSTEIIVRARGDIDLANRQLDLLAVPQAKTEKFLSVSAPIEVTGSFDDFSVGVAGGGFVMTMIRWYYGLIYVPWKWLTGERFPADGIATCYRAMDWELPTEAK